MVTFVFIGRVCFDSCYFPRCKVRPPGVNGSTVLFCWCLRVCVRVCVPVCTFSSVPRLKVAKLSPATHLLYQEHVYKIVVPSVCPPVRVSVCPCVRRFFPWHPRRRGHGRGNLPQKHVQREGVYLVAIEVDFSRGPRIDDDATTESGTV